MSGSWVLCCLLAAMAAVNVTGDTASAPSPAALDCSTVIFSMMDCLDYVSAGSNVTDPPASCCEGVAEVVGVSASCLCEALGMAPAMGIALNMSRAKGIPDACSVEIPPGEECAAKESVSPSPSAPSVDSPPRSPPARLSPPPASPPASVAPAQAPSSGASAVVSSSVLILVGLLAIAC